jgi:anti-sigma factor RsiW
MSQAHESIQENIPAYALGALSPEEAAAVRDHLRVCARCAEELRSYSRIPDALNVAVPDAPLPPGFTERLLDRTRPRPARALPPVQLAPRGRPAAAGRRHAVGVLSRLPWALAAASLILALALGGRAWQLDRELDQRRATVANLVALLGSPDVTVREGEASSSGVRTRVYETRQRDAALVVFDQMPQPPAGKTYQLWLGEGEKVESVTTFRPNQNGNWFRLLKPSGGLEAYESVGVSVEPEGGSPAPTTEWAIWAKL